MLGTLLGHIISNQMSRPWYHMSCQYPAQTALDCHSASDALPSVDLLYNMLAKVLKGLIKKYVITLKNTYILSWRQQVRHYVQKYVMTSNK